MLRNQRGPLERYRDGLSETVENMDSAIEQVQVDGIEAFNEGLIDAVVNFRSLGDVARRVLQQILADMLRLQLMKATLSFLGGAAGVAPGVSASTVASLAPGVGAMMDSPAFAGLFATGGLIPAGQFGIVGEEGPEPVIGTSRGAVVLPNSSLRAGGFAEGGPMIGQINVSVPARADPRLTQSSVSRGVQQGLSRSARKGIAAPAGRSV